MNESEHLERLAGRARLEQPPSVDVAAAVMARLASRQPRPALDPTRLVAALATLAAAVTLVFTWSWCVAVVDPLWSAITTLNWGMP
jgi:hypothetical protein